jgi:hypothetical protein
VASEAAGIGLGLLMVGTATEKAGRCLPMHMIHNTRRLLGKTLLL